MTENLGLRYRTNLPSGQQLVFRFNVARIRPIRDIGRAPFIGTPRLYGFSADQVLMLMLMVRRKVRGWLNRRQSAMRTLVWLLFAFLSFVSTVFGLFPATVGETRTPSNIAAIVEDMAGRKIAFESLPRTVVIFPPLQPSFATIDETTQHIVGMPDVLRSQGEGGLLFPRISADAIYSFDGKIAIPDVEWVMREQPDAVITGKSEVLEKTGFRVLWKLAIHSQITGTHD